MVNAQSWKIATLFKIHWHNVPQIPWIPTISIYATTLQSMRPDAFPASLVKLVFVLKSEDPYLKDSITDARATPPTIRPLRFPFGFPIQEL